MEPTGNNGLSPLDELQRQLNEDLAQVVAPTPPPLAAASAGSAPMVATTISTVVLQGGPLQLVIALLKVSWVLFTVRESESDYRHNDQPTTDVKVRLGQMCFPTVEWVRA